MPNEMHTHNFDGVTAMNDGHTHKYSGVTSPSPNVPGHVHMMTGSTTVDDRHSHNYNLHTSQSMPAEDGHTHFYEGPTSLSDRHVHNMGGNTSAFMIHTKSVSVNDGSKERIPLEKAAIDICDAAAVPPRIYQIPPEQGRERLNEAQNAPVYKFAADISSHRIQTTNGLGEFPLYAVHPENAGYSPHIILYIHGGGWVLGNFHTHEKLVRELAARTKSIILFPEYSLSPEAKYPVAIEQCYLVLTKLPEIMKDLVPGARLDTLTVAGDSVGGNMTAALTILSKYRNGPHIHKQLMFYPVTDAAFDTESYQGFAEGYYLYRDGMKWFWDQYTASESDRNHITASPLKATAEQLRGLPDAMIIMDEADVLRDEGEAYAKKLLKAGVDTTAVRILSITHDFVMLNALDQTNGCRAAMDLAISWINRKNLSKAVKN